MVNPKQGSFLNKEVKVIFNYDTTKVTHGRIVRDDTEEPFYTIILLNNGEYIMSTECQYQPEIDESLAELMNKKNA